MQIFTDPINSGHNLSKIKFMNQKIKEAAIWGFIVGDALGVPYEFIDREDMKLAPATGMIGFGTHHQPAGTWSDDTSMMLCVIENIKNNGSPKDLAKLFIRWYDDAYHTAHGEVFDIGITTRNAIHQLKAGVPVSTSGATDEYAAGNGSLMRCLPYAFAEDFAKSIYEMIIDNNITHRLTICNHCCMFYVKLLQAITKGYNKEDAVKAGAAYLKFGRRIVDSEDEEADVVYYAKFNRIFNADFKFLPESAIKSTGYVLHSLEASIWCFLNSNNYSDAVLKAVNLGGDTDTIAALTGGMAAAYYGVDNIPKEWLEQIARKTDIENLISTI